MPIGAILSNTHSSLATAEALPLVHNREPSVRSALPDTYQAHRAGFDLRAWHASGNFYFHVDEVLTTDYVSKWEACRRGAWFARHVDTGEVRVFTRSCRLRWCSLCSSARRAFITGEVANWIRHASYPKFLTLTLKHSNAPLLFQINSLYEYFRKYRHAKFFSDNTTGGIWFFQIKRAKHTGQWHPHIHCIIEGKYMQQRKLSKLWYRITSGSKIVDIRPIRDQCKAANEVARYASAPADVSSMDPTDYYEVFQSVHSRKTCGTWGSARSVLLKQPSATDKDSWRSVGDWSIVREGQGQFAEADSIVKAWLMQTPLEEGVSMREVEKVMMGAIVDGILEKPVQYQPSFFDT
ncbi:hypothetical protein ES703_32510 [subsurface metagenome]